MQIPLLLTLPSGFSDLPTALRRRRNRGTLDHEGRILGLNLFSWLLQGFIKIWGGGQKPLRFLLPCSSSLLLPKWGYLLVNNNNKLEKVLTDCCQQILGFKRLFLENNESIWLESFVLYTNTLSGAHVGMWTWGRVHTMFWQPPKPYSNQGEQIMPTICWCPHQVFKATGAPARTHKFNRVKQKGVKLSKRESTVSYWIKMLCIMRRYLLNS